MGCKSIEMIQDYGVASTLAGITDTQIERSDSTVEVEMASSMNETEYGGLPNYFMQIFLRSLHGGNPFLSRVELEDQEIRNFISDLNDIELSIFNEVAGHNSLNQTAIIKSPAAIRQFTKKMVGPNVDPIVKKLHKSDSREFLSKVSRNSNLSIEISNGIIGML